MRELIQHFAQNITIDTSPLPGSKLTTSKFQSGVDIFMAIAGAVALLIITIAGLRMVMSRGNPQTIAQSRTAILYTIVGLVIMIMAFTIVTFVLNGI